MDASDTSPEVSVIVSNVVSFPDWIPYYDTAFTNSLGFSAKVAPGNITWRLDIYGSQTNYIGTMTNSFADGSIDITWDLRDANGTLHAGEDFHFTLTTYSGGVPFSTSHSPPAIFKPDDWHEWPGAGSWVIANELAFEYLDDPEQYQIMANSVATIPRRFGLMNLPGWNGSFPVHTTKNTSFWMASNDWFSLKIELWKPAARNFYWFGHGDASSIGISFNPSTQLASSEIVGNLSPYPPMGVTNYHRYRFVFLDSCDSAKGHLSEAFGIPPGPSVTWKFMQNGLHPAFFAGWNTCPPTRDGKLALQDECIFITQWVEQWLLDRPIAGALETAGRQQGAQKTPYNKLQKNGCWDLHVNDYNENL